MTKLIGEKVKIISFSLWGNKPMYIAGAFENIKLAREIYPDWKCRFYVDVTVPEKTQDELITSGASVVMISSELMTGGNWGMFWRFFANDDPDMEVMISRDCDSRLSLREKAAVDEWISSDKQFHTMHDHYAHRSVPILGGMWGAKKGCVSGMVQKIMGWGNYKDKGIDQIFLRYIIWPIVCKKAINHSSIQNRWAESIPFPKHDECKFGVQYVGEMFDENNKAIEA